MKKLFYLIIIASIIIYFLLYPESAFLASKNGLLLWFNQILPTLLPFSIISSVLLTSGLFSFLDNRFQKNFVLSFSELFVMFCGFLFGFPIGSKLACDCKNRQLITQKQAQILCSFTNNLSPAFILSFVLVQELQMPERKPATLFILYVPPLLIGSILLLLARNKENTHKKTASRFQMNMQIIDAGIINGFETLIKLCGYIILFSIITSIFQRIPFPNPTLFLFLTGNIEVTNGIHLLAVKSFPDMLRYPAAIFLLSFGGLSGIAQTGSMIHPGGLSLKKYVIMKCIYTLCSVTLAILYELFV